MNRSGKSVNSEQRGHKAERRGEVKGKHKEENKKSQ